MGTAGRPAMTSPGAWDAFADVDVFVDEALAEFEAVARHGARLSWRSGVFVSAACSGARSGCRLSQPGAE